MDSYTENDIKKGQAVPDLFVMVPSNYSDTARQGRRIKLRCPPKVLTGTLHPSLPSIFSG